MGRFWLWIEDQGSQHNNSPDSYTQYRPGLVALYGSKPRDEFAHEIVGLDMNAAKEAFAGYPDEALMDSN